MTREEILDGLQKLQPWFHRIALGQGIQTKTASVGTEPADHPHEVWQIIKRCLPEDLSGKDVLDVGCNAGFYAIEAKRRGARRVLGVDAIRLHIRQATFVKNVLGMDIEYERMSVYNLNPHVVGQFDVTLALGLIYHCKHPMLALENLARVTRDTLILETATLPSEMLPVSLEHNVGGLMRTLYPTAYIENETAARESAYNWFLPGVESLQAMIKAAGFSDAELFDVREERAVFVCHKQAAYTDSLNPAGLAAQLTLLEKVEACRPDEYIRFRIEAKNSDFAHWLAAGEAETGRGAVRLAVHVLKENGEDVQWYRAASSLPKDVAPGESVALDVAFPAPERAGTYTLEFDMVAEYVTWFEDADSKTLRSPLRVRVQ